MSGSRPRLLYGIPASPGIFIGPAFVVDRRRTQIRRRRLAPGGIEPEVDRFRACVAKSVEQLMAVRARYEPADGHKTEAILDAHLLMLRDEALLGGTERRIRAEGVSAEWALRAATTEIMQAFDAIDDEYFRERRSDVEFVGERILRNLLGLTDALRPSGPGRFGLVAHDLSPADTLGLPPEQVGALVTAVGGRTSHTAIVARALELPAVVGVEGLLAGVEADDTLIVDGHRGEVVVRPGQAMLRAARERAEDLRSRAVALAEELAAPSAEASPVSLSANIEREDEVETALRQGADGIGLFRTEFLFMGGGAPSEAQQHRCYERILKRLEGRPATIRTLDMGGDKNPRLFRAAVEANPAMGLRSIRLSLRHPALFLGQLRALLRSAPAGRLRILFPLVSCPTELERALELLDQARAQLRARGQASPARVELGIMMEVPAAALMADVFARKVDFFSIGTNDLIQYTLAVDRHNERVAYLYEPLHPAVLRLLDAIVAAARRAGIRVSLCGEMAAEPLCLPVLLGLGLDEISMTPGALPLARHVLRRLQAREARRLVRDLLGSTDPRDSRAQVEAFMAERLPDLTGG
jgi:phosphotransferase system enzyme I (PtsI)